MSAGDQYEDEDEAGADGAVEEIELEGGIAPVLSPRADQPRVSREFVKLQVRNLEPMCWAPWRGIKVDTFSRTKVCSLFAHHLPEFDWPTAKEFHKETGMWNHPFMQHMRSGMGNSRELPFCTFCKTKDKRDPALSEEKRNAVDAQRAIFQEFLEKAGSAGFVGGIDAIDDLVNWSVTVPGAGRLLARPFNNDKNTYRKHVRRRGFVGLGNVLYLGCQWAGYAPFLAECGNALTVADLKPRSLQIVRAVLEGLDLPDAQYHRVMNPASLPFADSIFDGVWLDGRWLSTHGRKLVLLELKRVLKPGGRLCAIRAVGAGAAIASAETEEAIEAIAKGPAYDGAGSFLTAEQVGQLLTAYGLVTVKTLPPETIWYGAAPRFRADRDFSAIAQVLRNAVLAGGLRPALDGMERHISFVATAWEGRS